MSSSAQGSQTSSMAAVLASMGVDEYEPRVLHQLLEYTHRYCGEVFSDSAHYSEHSGRGAIECEDVQLAVRLKEAATQGAPPQLIRHLARKCNSSKLRADLEETLRFPKEEDCLVHENYQLLPPGPPRPPPRGDGEAAARPQAPRASARGALPIAINLRPGAGALPA